MSFGAQWAQKVTQKGKNVFYNFVLGVWRGAAGRSSILGGTTQPPTPVKKKNKILVIF